MAVKFISSEGSSTVVKVIQSASPDQQDGINPEIRKRSYGETSQFQENFEVYIQFLVLGYVKIPKCFRNFTASDFSAVV